jgi:hypothetical protein
MNLPEGQRMILFIDCWSVHKSEEFRCWMVDVHPFIKLLYVAAGCTSKGQPADVIQQKPLKAGIKRGFDLYMAGQVAKQIADGVPPSEVQLDLRMGTLREEIVKWAKESFHSLMGRQDMVCKGWKKCGLLRAFDPEFQKEALKLVADGTIAKPGPIEVMFGEEPQGMLAEEVIEGVPMEGAPDTLVDRVLGACLEDLPIGQWPTSGEAGPSGPAM